MIIEEIQGNIANLTAEEKSKHIEKVYLENSDLVKRIQRVTTDHGTELGIRLRQPIDLQYGDILYQDETNMIVVDVNSEDLLVIQPRTYKKWETLRINSVIVIYQHNLLKLKCLSNMTI